jgi:hypothetical protein
MTLIKKCDLKNYRSAHPRKSLRSFRPANKLALEPLSEIEPAKADAAELGFATDFLLEHSSSKEHVDSNIISVIIDDEVVPPKAATP